MIDGETLQLTTSEVLGLSGAALYSIGYVLSAYDRLPSQSPVYYAVKLLAACLVLFSLFRDFNLASAVIQVFFIAVSLIGIVRHFSPKRRRRAYERSRRAPCGTYERLLSPAVPDRQFSSMFKAPHPYARPDR